METDGSGSRLSGADADRMIAGLVLIPGLLLTLTAMLLEAGWPLWMLAGAFIGAGLGMLLSSLFGAD